MASEYTLLYNAHIAERLATVAVLESAFASYGIKLIAIAAQGELHFNELLLRGEYDLYLADILLQQNMDFSYFFDEQSAGYIAYSSQQLIAAYSDMKSTGNHEAFSNAFIEDQPIVPILFKEGTVYYQDWLNGLSPNNSNPYYRFFEVDYD